MKRFNEYLFERNSRLDEASSLNRLNLPHPMVSLMHQYHGLKHDVELIPKSYKNSIQFLKKERKKENVPAFYVVANSDGTAGYCASLLTAGFKTTAVFRVTFWNTSIEDIDGIQNVSWPKNPRNTYYITKDDDLKKKLEQFQLTDSDLNFYKITNKVNLYGTEAFKSEKKEVIDIVKSAMVNFIKNGRFEWVLNKIKSNLEQKYRTEIEQKMESGEAYEIDVHNLEKRLTQLLSEVDDMRRDGDDYITGRRRLMSSIYGNMFDIMIEFLRETYEQELRKTNGSWPYTSELVTKFKHEIEEKGEAAVLLLFASWMVKKYSAY